MKTTIIKALEVLGCDDKQQRFFLANLELGSAQISDIAKRARLQRSTSYLVAEELTLKGLISEDSRARGKLFTACSPSRLMNMLESHHRRIGKLNITFKKSLRNIEAHYNSQLVLPKVKTYHGQSGLLTVLKDILKAKGEILLWTNQLTEESVFSQELHDTFIAERVRLGIPARVLAINNRPGILLRENDNDCMRKTLLLPSSMNFSAETYLYDNKLALLDFSSDIIGIVIESDSVYGAQKSIFETTWQSMNAQSGYKNE